MTAAAKGCNFAVSPAHVLEPTYQAIKRHLLSAYWPMGTKLEAVKIADELGVSMTPVRDCLNQLYGERLVDFAPGEGFRVPHLSEGDLRDLLNLNLILLTAALGKRPLRTFEGLPDHASYPEKTAVIFQRLAERCENSALTTCVNSISDQLHVVRNIDLQLFDDAEAEIIELAGALKAGSTARALLKGLLPRYHERRKAAVSEYLRYLSVR